METSLPHAATSITRRGREGRLYSPRDLRSAARVAWSVTSVNLYQFSRPSGQTRARQTTLGRNLGAILCIYGARISHGSGGRAHHRDSTLGLIAGWYGVIDEVMAHRDIWYALPSCSSRSLITWGTKLIQRSATGCGTAGTPACDILPGVFNTIVVIATLSVGGLILAEATG